MDESSGHRPETIREGLTMALYISLSLLAVMVALPTNVTQSTTESPALLLALTSLGLLVAHQLAFRISARLAHRGELASEHLELLAAQLVGGLLVTAVAVVPVILIGGSLGVLVSELLLLAFVAMVGYAAARTVPVSRFRALLYVAGVVLLSLAVLWIKSLVAH
jgi:hypothetical protein